MPDRLGNDPYNKQQKTNNKQQTTNTKLEITGTALLTVLQITRVVIFDAIGQ